VIAGTHYERQGHAASSAALRRLAPAHATLRGRASAPLLGFYAPPMPRSDLPLRSFARRTGTKPALAVYYSSWGEPFRTDFANTVARRGGAPLVQIEPSTVSMTQITDGSQDPYLISYAKAVRAFGHPVVLSFGHEMNGAWYNWGYRHVPPAEFAAAWRYIVDVFRAQGADNVTWLWTVNVYADAASQIANPEPWWPGDNYVDWVGLDGHYTTVGEDFANVFSPMIASVRAFTAKPVLVSETAIGPAAGQAADMNDLFAGVKDNGLIGLVWFDAEGNEDWRLQTPSALDAFAVAARRYGFDPTGS
jgi:hypothetical protein